MIRDDSLTYHGDVPGGPPTGVGEPHLSGVGTLTDLPADSKGDVGIEETLRLLDEIWPRELW